MEYRLKHVRKLVSVPKEQIDWLINECSDDYSFCEEAKDFFDCYIVRNVCGTDYRYLAYEPLNDYDFDSDYFLLVTMGNEQKKAAYTFTDTLNCLLYSAKELGYRELCENIENMIGTLFEKEKGIERFEAEEKLNINRHELLNKKLSILITHLIDEYERTGRDVVDSIDVSIERDKIIDSSIIKLSVNAKANLCL